MSLLVFEVGGFYVSHSHQSVSFLESVAECQRVLYAELEVPLWRCPDISTGNALI